MEFLEKALTCGEKLCATHCEQYTSDDMLKACECEVLVSEAKIKHMVQNKEKHLLCQNNEKEKDAGCRLQGVGKLSVS